jgi:23S rRNA (guanosine2251-2'-O)-methyltransferase
MSRRPQHSGRPHSSSSHHGGKPSGGGPSNTMIWGWHAAMAALANPQRKIKRLLLTATVARQIEGHPGVPKGLKPEVLDPRDFDRRVPAGAVHQGIAVEAEELEGLDLADVLERDEGLIVVLDQVTDPQNVGALFRSAAAFGAFAMVLQDRKAPPLTGALAKAAVGTIERVGEVRVVNIARALEELNAEGWLTVGLAGEAPDTLDKVLGGQRKIALVMGAEGEGLRQLVAANCAVTARIPIASEVESLNVSAAAAIALYEARRALG